MSLLWRSWQIVTVLVVTVLGVFTLLATLQFHRIESDLVSGRLGVLATTAQAPFRSAARIGLPLSSVRNATAILERAQTTDPQIVAIHVFAPDGRILHSTDREPPTSVRAEVLFAAAGAADAPWSHDTGDLLFTGKAIRDAGGAVVGGIVVTYPTLDLRTAVQAMATKLLSHSVLILLGIAPLTALLLRLGLRRPLRLSAALTAMFDGFERDAWRSGAGGAYRPGDKGHDLGYDTEALSRLLHEAEAQYITQGHALRQLERGEEL